MSTTGEPLDLVLRLSVALSADDVRALTAWHDAEIRRLRADLAKLEEPVEDMAAFRLRFRGAVAAIEAAERERWTRAVRTKIPKIERFDDQRAAGNTCRAILAEMGIKAS